MYYKHFKGNIYKVICEATHTETGEVMVVYKNIAEDHIWVRPKEMFFENITTPSYTGPRFIPIDPPVE